MNNLIVFGIFCAISGIFLSRIWTLIIAVINQKRRQKEYPYIESAHQNLLCKGPHKWDTTKLVMPPLPIDSYKVCTECGFIAGVGMNWKLNSPALEVYRSHIKKRDEKTALKNSLFKKKQIAIQDIMNRMIKHHISDLGIDLHKNVEVLQQFFRKSTLELDSLNSTINKELNDEELGG